MKDHPKLWGRTETSRDSTGYLKTQSSLKPVEVSIAFLANTHWKTAGKKK